MITITVSGPAGEGKTALCQLICELLISHDVPVVEMPDVLSPVTHFSEERTSRELALCLQSIGNTTSVAIKEVHTPKS